MARSPHGRTRVSWHVVLATLCSFLFAPCVSAASPITCAVVGDRSVANLPLAPLLQQNIQADFPLDRLRWVDREDIGKVLTEQTLATAFGPAGASDRIKVGEILKADLLVLIRQTTVPKATVDVVVFETKTGLRLAVASAALPKDAAKWIDDIASALEPVVATAIRKADAPIRTVVTIPPFISNDLSFRYDSFKAIYARLLEQIVLDQPDMLVVELEEAKAIALEMAIAGERQLKRPLPIFLLGEFQHPTDATVSLKLSIKSGEQSLGELTQSSVPNDQAATFLRKAAGDLLSKAQVEVLPFTDPATESRQLAERARLFQRLGDWQASLHLIETSLLLEDKVDLHHDAVIAYGVLSAAILGGRGDTQTVAEVEQAIDYHLRGLEHLEILLKTVPTLEIYRRPGQNTFVDDFNHAMNGWVIPGRPKKEVVSALASGHEKARDILYRIARMRARDRRNDETQYVLMATWDMPEKQQYDVMARFIEEWKDIPGNARRVFTFGSHGYTIGVLAQPEGRAFLEKVELIDNAEIRKAVVSLRRQVDSFVERRKQEQATWDKELAARRATDEANRAGPADVVFRPVDLVSDVSTSRPAVVRRCVPCGDGIDAFWGQSLYLMKTRGTLKPVWQPTESNCSPARGVFDGKYLWLPVTRHAKPPLLLVVDPASEKVWELSSKDGFPVAGIDEQSAGMRQQFLRVAPLGPGRVCVAGTFGRAWLAIVKFDPALSPGLTTSVNVFHEARELPNEEDKTQWQSPAVVFAPGDMLTLADAATGKQRVLISRGNSSIKVRYHPLLVDPETLRVSVVQDEACWAEVSARDNGYDHQVVSYEGSAYWAWPTRRRSIELPEPSVYRLGWPDFNKHTVAQSIHTSREAKNRDHLFFHQGKVFIAARDWWVTDSLDKPFRKLRGVVPDTMDTDRLFKGHENVNEWPDEQTERVEAVCASNHYGLLCFTQRNKSGGNVYHVEFPGLDAK